MDTTLTEQLKQMKALAGINESKDWEDILSNIRQLSSKLRDIVYSNQSMLSGESGRNISAAEALNHEFGENTGKALMNLVQALDTCSELLYNE